MKNDFMTLLQKYTPGVYHMIMRIAEPRFVRVVRLGIYICMGIAGVVILAFPPESFESLVGWVLVLIFGAFILLGGLLCSVAILPGIWWLERAGLIFLITGMVMYAFMAAALGGSALAVLSPVAFALTFIVRWTEIRLYQLEPREE